MNICKECNNSYCAAYGISNNILYLDNNNCITNRNNFDNDITSLHAYYFRMF